MLQCDEIIKDRLIILDEIIKDKLIILFFIVIRFPIIRFYQLQMKTAPISFPERQRAYME
jgi:hypothetical protein